MSPDACVLPADDRTCVGDAGTTVPVPDDAVSVDGNRLRITFQPDALLPLDRRGSFSAGARLAGLSATAFRRVGSWREHDPIGNGCVMGRCRVVQPVSDTATADAAFVIPPRPKDEPEGGL